MRDEHKRYGFNAAESDALPTELRGLSLQGNS